MARRLVPAVLCILLAVASPAAADLIEDGWAAFERGDFTTAFKHWADAEKHWRPLAEQGDAEGQFKLGIMHLNGYGMAQDDDAAQQLFRGAAEKGHPGAQVAYGSLFMFGIGVEVDQKEGVKWYERAAEQDHPAAQYALGMAYSYGYGVSLDRSKAIAWYRKAAENGEPNAQYELFKNHLMGWGVSKDKIRAVMWLSLAATQGHEEAQMDVYVWVQGLSPTERAKARRLIDEWLAARPQFPAMDYDVWTMLFVINEPAQDRSPG